MSKYAFAIQNVLSNRQQILDYIDILKHNSISVSICVLSSEPVFQQILILKDRYKYEIKELNMFDCFYQIENTTDDMATNIILTSKKYNIDILIYNNIDYTQPRASDLHIMNYISFIDHYMDGWIIGLEQ